MKSFLFVFLIVVVSTAFLNAQNINLTGSVKDEKGNALHFVFIADYQSKTATFSDSLGNFTIAVRSASKLQFESEGYQTVVIDMEQNKGNVDVVLKATGAAVSGNSSSGRLTETQNINYNDLATIGTGGIVAPAHQKGKLHGNQYLFDTFVYGFIINSAGELVYNSSYLFDYDKIGGGLLLTKDKRIIEQIDRNQTTSFTLYNNKDERFVFENAPAVDNKLYAQILATGKKYKIYKLIKTTFIKSDYVTNGLTSHGNDYDEYVDDADYFVYDVQANKAQKCSLRKKSLKTAFAAEADKINKFLSENSSDIDDAYLAKLGDYMNQ